MSLYLGNKKVAPIVYVENKDLPLKTLMVTNKSSSDVKKGDTVWINEGTTLETLPKEYSIIDDKEITGSSIKGVASENIAIGTKVANVENGGTEVDGIMSTYVLNETKTDSITIYKDKSFEGVFKIKASEWLNDNHFIQTQPNFFYVRGGSRYLWAVFNFSSSGSESYTDISFSSTEWIYLKIAYNSNMISWSYSLDGQEYTAIKTVTGRNTFLDNLTTLSFNLYFGCKFGSTNYETWSGQIDFNECYFRVDGKTVWSGIKYINGGSGLVKINTTSEIIETETEKIKYGCDIDCFLGDVDITNKTLQRVTKSFNFELSPDIEDLGDYALRQVFTGTTVSEALLSNLKKITGKYALSYAFNSCTYLTKVDLQNLVEVGGNTALGYAFSSCPKLEEVNFQKLKTINGVDAFVQTFKYCPKLSNISFSSLEEINGGYAFSSIFYNSTNLAEINFPKLSIINGNYALEYAFSNTAITEINFPSLSTLIGGSPFASAFDYCTNLNTVRFSALKTLQGAAYFTAAFSNCTNLTDIYFDSLTTESFVNNTTMFQQMMSYSGTNVVHTLHFPSNLETSLQSLVTYPLFGGTSGYVDIAFDLPATS